MNTLKLNETPVRTSRNFNINNIKLEDVEIPKDIKDFKNVSIEKESLKDTLNDEIDDFEIKYGVGLENIIKEKSNSRIKLNINTKTKKDIKIDYYFDKENINLLENIEIVASENTKSNIVICYESESDVQAFHNGIIKVFAKENSVVNIIVINLLNIL